MIQDLSKTIYSSEFFQPQRYLNVVIILKYQTSDESTMSRNCPFNFTTKPRLCANINYIILYICYFTFSTPHIFHKFLSFFLTELHQRVMHADTVIPHCPTDALRQPRASRQTERTKDVTVWMAKTRQICYEHVSTTRQPTSDVESVL